MSALLKAIFQPKDGTRERVREQIANSQEAMKRAANRFESTVSELLDRNDRLTGRIGRRGDDEDDSY